LEAAVAAERMIVGISGASGFVYGVRTLELLRAVGCETHLVVSQGAERTRQEETSLTSELLRDLADVAYRITDIGAAIASGSFRTKGMIIAPCSIRTLSQVAYTQADNLLTRAADVCLKERRRIVMLVRECMVRSAFASAGSLLTQSGLRKCIRPLASQPLLATRP
jgi:4-hydroxy-3-polyprenylbenzoate decarboxylase